MPPGKIPCVCWRCKKRTMIPFDAVFEHVEFETHKAGFCFRFDPCGELRVYCTACASLLPDTLPPPEP